MSAPLSSDCYSGPDATAPWRNVMSRNRVKSESLMCEDSNGLGADRPSEEGESWCIHLNMQSNIFVSSCEQRELGRSKFTFLVNITCLV